MNWAILGGMSKRRPESRDGPSYEGPWRPEALGKNRRRLAGHRENVRERNRVPQQAPAAGSSIRLGDPEAKSQGTHADVGRPRGRDMTNGVRPQDKDEPLPIEVLSAMPYSMREKHVARQVYLRHLTLEQAAQLLSEASRLRAAWPLGKD